MPHQHHAKHHNHGRDVNLEARNPDATVIQVVTETASKTFDGPIGGYSTVNAPSAAPMTQSSKRVQAPPSSQVQPATQVQPAAQVLPATQATPSTQVQPSTSAQPQPAQPQPQPQPQSAQPQPSTSANSSLAPIAQISATPQTSSQQAATQSSTPSTGAQSVSPSTPSSSTQSKSSVSSQVSSDPVSAIPPSSSVLPTSDTPTPTSSFVAQSATSSASSTSTSIATTRSNGMSGGAKAGLIIGILFGIVALLALVFFCYRRKKQNVNEAYEKHDDEKAQTSFANEGGPVGVNRVPSIQPANQISTAPQLSLRPVTEFSPDLAAQRARINALAAAGGPARTSVNNTANPFGNHAEMSVKSPPSTQPTSPTNPFGNHAEMETPAADESIAPPAQVPAPLRVRTPTPEGAAAIAGGAVAGAGLAATAAGAGAGRQKTPKPLNLSPNRPTRNGADLPMPSPTGTEFSMSSMTPSAVANGPPPSNVHRIQLDFKPSMEDELELCAGQLVRLLHEYDDGWALCIRLDRSQQGVAPRTCLSARPVKPRPPPGARGPAQGPRVPPPGTMGSGQQRPSSPAGGHGSPSPYNRAPRSASPGPAQQQRSMSPGPYGGGPQQRPNVPVPGQKRRSNSASEVRERRNSPPGPSPMNPNANNLPPGSQKVPMQLQAITPPGSIRTATPPQRKPVPGQAM